MTDPQQLQLLSQHYAEPLDTRTQCDRLPGTADCECLCGKRSCGWPFCEWKHYERKVA